MVNASTTNITNSGFLWQTGAVFASSTIQATGNLWSYAKLGVGTSTPSMEISATSTSATTTLYLSSDSTTKGGCIQVEGADGTTYRLTAGNAVAATTTGGEAGFTAYWVAGACK